MKYFVISNFDNTSFIGIDEIPADIPMKQTIYLKH